MSDPYAYLEEPVCSCGHEQSVHTAEGCDVIGCECWVTDEPSGAEDGVGGTYSDADEGL